MFNINYFKGAIYIDSDFNYRIVYEIVFLLLKPILKADLPLDEEGILINMVGYWFRFLSKITTTVKMTVFMILIKVLMVKWFVKDTAIHITAELKNKYE